MHQLCEYINIKPLLDPCCKHGAQQQFVMCMWCFYSDQPVSFTSAFELSAPTSGRGVNCVHFSLLADLSTLSVWAGGMFHQWVSWIVPMNEPCPACAYTPHTSIPHVHPPPSLFTSAPTHADLSPPALPVQRLQCEHGRALTCLQACVGAGHVVSAPDVLTWDCCVSAVLVRWTLRSFTQSRLSLLLQ